MDSFTERRLRALLARGFRHGAVEVTFPSGAVHRFGHAEVSPLRLRFTDEAAVRAAWLDPELQVPELYMHGRLTVDDGDIKDLLVDVKKSGRKRFASGPAVVRAAGRLAHRWLRRHVLPETAQRNVAHHYDLDAKLFRIFLDKDLQYSCAYFETGEETLEEAQRKKKRHIAAKMLLQPGQRVLDIGCGWGGMALYLAEVADVEVVGVTLSEEQIAVARRRAEEAGLADRVRFELLDYRKVAGPFDRIVSIGMFEHVGPQHFGAFFAKIRELLAPDGVALLHSMFRAKPNLADPPFVEKYIFPNGHIPALSEVMPGVERAGLLVKDVEVLTWHYADTIAMWRERFHANREEVLRIYDETFFRMWDVYLAASEVSLRHGRLANFQMQLTRRQAEGPRNRGYVGREEARLAAKEPPLDR
ncbi:MAG: cyclopropane-fatty-acyl-phospholipid synthase family protein [Pseudomonadota bacterium]